ncbi:MAG: GNAT family N-acetyltransferase [Lachnospiraceae bacterium]|nr:GNAT family N-acetyltransferase [Lachnospiraceae bacterium]
MNREDISIASVGVQEFHKIENVVSKQYIEMAKNNECQIIAGIENNSIIGAMCIKVNEDANYFEILDIYVVEDKRRQMAATYMISKVVEDLCEKMDYMLEGIVAKFVDTNEIAINFFEGVGFVLYKDEDYNKLSYTLEDIKKSYLMEKDYSIPAEYTLIRYKVMDNLKKRQMVSVIEKNDGNYDMNFAIDLDEELSISVWKEDELVGTVEIILEENGEISLGQMFIIKMSPVMIAVLQKIAKELFDKYSDDTLFSAYVISESSRNLLTKLLGESNNKQNLLIAELSFMDELELDDNELGEEE